mmetsp:Transcript_12489/g.21853  ORF Transcript_12489/g.21853 Transcript_12489/m.21853 type:complete len:260 (-) Transcript_12489:292-1071(-)
MQSAMVAPANKTRGVLAWRSTPDLSSLNRCTSCRSKYMGKIPPTTGNAMDKPLARRTDVFAEPRSVTLSRTRSPPDSSCFASAFVVVSMDLPPFSEIRPPTAPPTRSMSRSAVFLPLPSTMRSPVVSIIRSPTCSPNRSTTCPPVFSTTSSVIRSAAFVPVLSTSRSHNRSLTRFPICSAVLSETCFATDFSTTDDSITCSVLRSIVFAAACSAARFVALVTTPLTPPFTEPFSAKSPIFSVTLPATSKYTFSLARCSA